MKLPKFAELWPIESDYPHSLQPSIISFMSPNSKIVEQKEILVEPDLSYVEYPIKVLDQKERVTRTKVVKMYKI
jgi:hypothetical protein